MEISNYIGCFIRTAGFELRGCFPYLLADMVLSINL